MVLPQVRHLLDSFLATQPDSLDYAGLVQNINWVESPVRPACPSLVRVNTDSWHRATPARLAVESVQYRDFMEDLKNKI